MKTITTTALATIVALGATAAQAEIRLGASLSATGPAAFLGDPEAKTLEMLVEEVNAAGGINGEEIALTLYDDGGDANKVRTFATRLVEDDEVVAIIGGSTTGTTMSILSVAEDEGMVRRISPPTARSRRNLIGWRRTMGISRSVSPRHNTVFPPTPR